MTALIIAIAGCIIFAAFIVGLVGWLWFDLYAPRPDEPYDQISDCDGRFHAHPDTDHNGGNNG